MIIGIAVAVVALVFAVLALLEARRADAATKKLRAELDALKQLFGARVDGDVEARAPRTGEAGEVAEVVGLARADSPLVAETHAVERLPATVEHTIGLVWVTRIGAALLAVGAIYFFQVAVERGWLGPWGRVGVGLAACVVCIGVAAAVRRQTSAAWVAVLIGIGLAIALGAVWAAHALYQLVPGLVAFGAVTAIVLGAAALAATWRMQAVLGTATLSAFVNLGALSTGLPGHAALLGYAAVVGAVAIIVAADKRWSVAALIVAPGAIAAFVVRHFGIVGIPLNVTNGLDAGLAIGLALVLAAIIVWGARAMPARVQDGMHAGAGLLAGGVAVSLIPLSVFGVMALGLGYRLTSRPSESKAPLLLAGIGAMAMLGLAAIPLPLPLAIAGAAAIGIAALGTRVELGVVGVAAGAAALTLGDVTVAAAGAGAATFGALALIVAKQPSAGVASAVALALGGVLVVLAKLPLAAAAAFIGGLALLGAVLAGWLARRAPAWVSLGLALVSVAHAVLAESPALLAFAGLALALFPFCAGRDRGARIPAALANVVRGLGLMALALAAVGAAGDAFDASGAKTVAQTLALGAFGAAIVAWGFAHAAVLDRWFGLVTLGVAVAKLVFWDVSQLDVVARTLILVLFGVLLLVSGFLYARSVAKKR